MITEQARPPLPPFTLESAQAKVQAAEDGWNSRDPDRVAQAYSRNTSWRNRTTFLEGRKEVRGFLEGKWERELDYRLRKKLWAFTDNRISVTFEYEYHDVVGQWHRAYGNEQWEFDADGLMRRREASINEEPIAAHERKFLWERV
jgi:nuclear transport factor 2 (NTF2) superfamily protein